MIDSRILSRKELKEALSGLPGWFYKNSKIRKEFMFKDFMDALNFINELAVYCEQENHHPEVYLLYDKVLFALQTFDVGRKITDKDITLAKKIEDLYINKMG